MPDPPTIRDFYAFEQHVKAARARRNAEMIPEWYEIPVFYFSNTAALFGTDERVSYPAASHEVDFELEMACVIGQEGSDIAAEDAPAYIAGYMVMNDWSARDLQRQEMKMNLGPAKGKDFATSLGPWLVTPDELEDRRTGSGADERYDLAMTGRINGDQLTSDNFKTIYFTFPQMIARASQHVRLRPGDILGSGTCGTGCILELGTERHRWLRPGDVVEMEIERLGVLRNTLVRTRGGVATCRCPLHPSPARSHVTSQNCTAITCAGSSRGTWRRSIRCPPTPSPGVRPRLIRTRSPPSARTPSRPPSGGS